MSYKQQVICPSCKHEHFVTMELVDLYFERNKQLERAFRNIFGICVDEMPFFKDADQALAELKEKAP